MKRLGLIGLLAIGLGACTTAQTQTSITAICVAEGLAYNYYMLAIAPNKPPTQVAKVEQAHVAMTLLCEAGATYVQIVAANEKALAERSK